MTAYVKLGPDGIGRRIDLAYDGPTLTKPRKPAKKR